LVALRESLEEKKCIEQGRERFVRGRVRTVALAGVATVVCKLFNIVQPHLVFFGQKDAQQCVVIDRMVRDLNMDLQVDMLLHAALL
jgi:pantothenate synthetase